MNKQGPGYLEMKDKVGAGENFCFCHINLEQTSSLNQRPICLIFHSIHLQFYLHAYFLVGNERISSFSSFFCYAKLKN